ncbi:MAG: hypothetical protein HKN74_04725 [Acidimicrobiia bacterium]|nr:hypothetical protein [Acidimicrobiia bacterium]
MATACGDDTGTPAVPDSESAVCADVVGAEVAAESDGVFAFSVTVRSPDTGWEKYADAWEVRAPDGTVLGTRILTHPHVEEQPFTRSLRGVEVPAGVDTVEIAARDSVEGFCGETVLVELVGRP